MRRDLCIRHRGTLSLAALAADQNCGCSALLSSTIRRGQGLLLLLRAASPLASLLLRLPLFLLHRRLRLGLGRARRCSPQSIEARLRQVPKVRILRALLQQQQQQSNNSQYRGTSKATGSSSKQGSL